MSSQPTRAEPAAVPREELDPRRWLGLGVVLIAAFMLLIDISIVNVAIPSIQRDLHASYSQVQWVLAGYQLAFAVVLITGGRLGDIFGRKRLFLIGVTGFTLASALCGAAQNPGMLVGSRLLQGLMGAMLYPQVISIIQVTFPPRERGTALGMFGAAIGLATISGPLAGGLLIQGNLLGLDWRPIFLVNLPIGAIAVAAAVVLLRESRSEDAPRLDPVGVTLATAALLALVFPLVEGRDLGWPAWIFVLLAASVPLFVLFAVYERYKTRKDNSPLLVLALFRERAFVSGLLLSAVFFSGIAAFFLTFSLFLQIGLGFTALHAGLTTIPFSAGTALASTASTRLAPRLGRRILSLGCLLLTAGMGGVILTINRAGAGLHSWQLLPALLVCGIGLGLTVAPLVNVILAGISGRNAGSASGALTTIQQVGGAVGVAIIGVIFFGLLSSQAAPTVGRVAPQLRSGLETAGLPAPTVDQVAGGFRVCFEDRAGAKDPSTTPASCQRLQSQAASQGGSQLQGQQAGQVLQAAATDARKQDFVAAIERTLWYEVAVYALSCLLVFLLPSVRAHRLRREGGAPAA
jgi:EmrB/QacA subfamily drug resistance transporter